MYIYIWDRSHRGKQSITNNEEFQHCHLLLAEAENERYIMSLEKKVAPEDEHVWSGQEHLFRGHE